MNVEVTCTVPASMLKWARSHGYVPSRILRDAFDKLMGGDDDLVRVESQIRQHLEQARLLESARERIIRKHTAADAKMTAEKARQRRLAELSEEFWADSVPDLSGAGRPNIPRSELSRTANLNHAEGWIKHNPILRGMKAEEVLDLVLSLKAQGAVLDDA